MESLLAQFSSFNAVKYIGVEDGADKASFLFSVIILISCSIIISTKQYIMNDISCYIPIMASGNDLDKYIKNYCWVHGTIPFRENETLPQTKIEWQAADDTKRLNYYQWVPFVLALQGMLFYLPRLIWKSIVYNLSGVDLEGLIVSSRKATNQVGDVRKETIEQVAKCLEDMLLKRRFIGNQRYPKLKKQMYQAFCNPTTGFSLIVLYFLIKILYLSNAIYQILLMQRFLSVTSSKLDITFGWTILKDIISGKQWNNNLLFPRVSFCYVGGISLVGSKNNYLAQCALPINMLNEKIYIFLWFWTVGVAILTLISIPLWLFRMTFLHKRKEFIKKFLKTKSCYTKEKHRELISQYVERFLRHDGIFILHIISLNSGDLVATDIVAELWDIFVNKYVNADFRKGVISKYNEKDQQSFI